MMNYNTIKIFISLFLILNLISKSQTYNLDTKYQISLPQWSHWKISTDYCDTIKKNCQYFQLRKDIKGEERKFSKITIKYEKPNKDVLLDLIKENCDFGIITKIDTVNISGYTVRRLFGTNCNWTKEDSNDSSVVGYSINLIMNLDDFAYLRIMSDYFTADQNELGLFQTEVLSWISAIKIIKR